MGKRSALPSPPRAQAAPTEGNFTLQTRMEMKSWVIIGLVSSGSIMCERGPPGSGKVRPFLSWAGHRGAVGSVHRRARPVSSGHVSL